MVENYCREFSGVVKRVDFPANLISTVDETGLFWK
jgi:hypothetical protein